jgi:hypothetical protein
VDTDALSRPPQPEISAKVVIQTNPPPAAPAKKRTSKKAKQGRKKIVSGPILPWPPREGAVPVHSTTASSNGPSANESTTEHKEGTFETIHGVTSPVAEPQSHEAPAPADGPRDTKDLSSMPRKTSLTSNDHQANTVEKDIPEHTEHDGFLDTTATETVLDGRTATLSRDHSIPPRGVASTNGEVSDSLISAPYPVDTEIMVKQAQYHVTEQSTPSAAFAINLDTTSESHARKANIHRVPSDESPASGPSRIVKPSRKTRLNRGNNSNVPPTDRAFKAHPGPVAIDIAWNNLRSACLADQNQTEHRMSFVVAELKTEKAELKAEKAQLQDTVSQQLTTIIKQRCQLDNMKTQYARLSDTAKSNQKYVAGLQKDHEKLRKSVLSCQEKNKQTLEAQKDEINQEKEALRVQLESTVDTLSKRQRSLLDTTEEALACCSTARVRERELYKQLEELLNMYKAEKDRRIEIEKQLLPSVHSMQDQLKESTAALKETFASLRTDLQDRANQDDRFRSIEECVIIVRKLEAQPILTPNDVRKAEGMLRFLYER